MKSLFWVGVLSFLVLISPALALNITLSVDKTKVFMGDNITMTGKVAFDNGTSAAFQYRAAVVAPKGIIVCDSNKTTTASDGSFTLNCKIPTVQEATSLGIPASERRSVIPYVAGVAVKDPVENQTVKRHARAIIAISQDKFNKELDGIIKTLDEFTNHSKRFVPECDAIAEKATRFNLTDITTKCLEIQQDINDLINNATALSEQARQLKNNATMTNVEEFRDSIKILRDNMKDLRDDLKNIKENIGSIKWEKLKEVRKSAEEIRDQIQEKREEIKGLRDKARGIRNE